jgi:hypothetical protein
MVADSSPILTGACQWLRGDPKLGWSRVAGQPLKTVYQIDSMAPLRVFAEKILPTSEYYCDSSGIDRFYCKRDFYPRHTTLRRPLD